MNKNNAHYIFKIDISCWLCFHALNQRVNGNKYHINIFLYLLSFTHKIFKCIISGRYLFQSQIVFQDFLFECWLKLLTFLCYTIQVMHKNEIKVKTCLVNPLSCSSCVLIVVAYKRSKGIDAFKMSKSLDSSGCHNPLRVGWVINVVFFIWQQWMYKIDRS